MKNRTQIDPRTLSGRPATPKSVPKASRERLGSVSGHPWRAPGAPSQSPSAARDARKSARDRPEGRRVDQNRRRVASEIQKIEFFPCGSFAKRYRSECSPILGDFRQIPKVCEPSEVSCLPAKTEVRAFALRVELLVRCYLAKRRKLTPKSTPNRRKLTVLGAFGGTWASESTVLGSSAAGRRRIRPFWVPGGSTAPKLGRPWSVLGQKRLSRCLDDPRSPGKFFV